MIRVLYFVDRLRRGGIQSLLYDMLRTVDRNLIRFEVLTLDDGEHYELEDRIADLGVTVYKLQGVWLRTPWNIFHYVKSVKHFFATHHDYAAVHLNSSSKNFLILHYARIHGIKVRIAHAHNSGFQTHNPLYAAVGHILKPMLCREATDLVACSEEAGRWMFGRKQALRMKRVKNGIVSSEFAFNGEWRAELRSSLSLPADCMVLGCVGRLVNQKNQSFLLQVASILKKRNLDFRMLFVGAGEKEQELRELAKALDVTDEVIFLGFREDRNRWYSAFDVFVLPSLYEGLPVTLVEAQASGLPAIVSDKVTTEAKLSDEVKYLPIDAPDAYSQWANAISKLSSPSNCDRMGAPKVKDAGFDISTTLSQLYRIYQRIS